MIKFEQFPFQNSNKRDLADNVAVINATDLSPIMENTDIKEIRELVAPDNEPKLEISLKVAELPTTTPIEVAFNEMKFFQFSLLFSIHRQ